MTKEQMLKRMKQLERALNLIASDPNHETTVVRRINGKGYCVACLAIEALEGKKQKGHG